MGGLLTQTQQKEPGFYLAVVTVALFSVICAAGATPCIIAYTGPQTQLSGADGVYSKGSTAGEGKTCAI